MSALIIAGGSVVDGSGSGAPVRADVVVVDGIVTQIGASVDRPSGAVELDASGCIVGPGLIDLHTHLREPGAGATLRDDRDALQARRMDPCG